MGQMKIFRLFFCIFSFVAATADAATVLYCQSNFALGITHDDDVGRWETGNFPQERFTMKFEDDFSSFILNGNKYSCLDGGVFRTWHPIICKDDRKYSSFTLNIDKQSLNFVLTQISIAGYASTANEIADTDNIYAGTCEEF